MVFGWLKPNRQKIRNELAEDMGYNNGWLGLTDSNPFYYNSPEWVAYNWGYNSALDDVDEWAKAYYTPEDDMMVSLSRMQ